MKPFTLITRLLSPISRYTTIWDGFAVSKSPRIQSSILKIIDFFIVNERFRFLAALFFPSVYPLFFLNQLPLLPPILLLPREVIRDGISGTTRQLKNLRTRTRVRVRAKTICCRSALFQSSGRPIYSVPDNFSRKTVANRTSTKRKNESTT